MGSAAWRSALSKALRRKNQVKVDNFFAELKSAMFKKLRADENECLGPELAR